QKISQYLFSSSARIATPYQDHGKSKSAASVIGAVDYYTSDFGTLHIVPNRFQRERDVHVLDTKHWEMQFLDGYQSTKMAKNSDGDSYMMTVDATLCSKNEAASGIVADIDSSLAMVA
ncbi:SU10 major capsid protein, partial [Porticoccus sp.]